MKNILDKVTDSHSLTKEEILQLLMNTDDSLFKAADDTRKKFKGDAIHLRALIEFSNICKRNCKYCGIRRDNLSAFRYRMDIDDIIKTAESAKNSGFKTVVLQSGEDPFFSISKLEFIISEIKKFNVAITLGIGEMTKEEYKKLKNAGADRFLLRIETTDKTLYQKMHPNMSLENRVQCLKDLKSLGFETGTGIIVGLPEQTIASFADDILFFKEFNADMIGIGPFIPHPQTPLAHTNTDNNFINALKVMAITRLLLPDINIPATTAMETLKTNGRLVALKSGANVVMPNVVPTTISSKYDIYPDKVHDSLDKIITDIKSINRFVSNDYGFRNN